MWKCDRFDTVNLKLHLNQNQVFFESQLFLACGVNEITKFKAN